MASAQASGLHETPDPLRADPDLSGGELGVDPAHARIALQLRMDPLDLFGEPGIGALALARPLSSHR